MFRVQLTVVANADSSHDPAISISPVESPSLASRCCYHLIPCGSSGRRAVEGQGGISVAGVEKQEITLFLL